MKLRICIIPVLISVCTSREWMQRRLIVGSGQPVEDQSKDELDKSSGTGTRSDLTRLTCMS